MRISTTQARKHLTVLIARVQDPRETIVLTRHDKPVAALVCMSELERIWKQKDIDKMTRTEVFPTTFTFGKGMKHTTTQEAAEEIQRIQMDRAMERSVLRKAGMEPFPNGELTVEIAAPTPRSPRKWWQVWKWVEKASSET